MPANVAVTLRAHSRVQAPKTPDHFRVSYIDTGQYTSQDVLLDVSSTFD